MEQIKLYYDVADHLHYELRFTLIRESMGQMINTWIPQIYAENKHLVPDIKIRVQVYPVVVQVELVNGLVFTLGSANSIHRVCRKTYTNLMLFLENAKLGNDVGNVKLRECISKSFLDDGLRFKRTIDVRE